MATVYGANTNKAVNIPTDLVDAVDNGTVYVFSDTYEASALAADSLIGVAELPPGAKVKEMILAWDALGASTTLIAGDAGDDNRYITSQDTSSAGMARLNAITGMDYPVSLNDSGNDTTLILLKLAGAAGTGTIRTQVFYGY